MTSSFIILGCVTCVFDSRGEGGEFDDWESLDLDSEIMISDFTIKQEIKNRFQHLKLPPRVSCFLFSTDFWTIRERIRYAKLFS